MNTIFYAYVHARPDGRVFYVGKGKGKRSHRLSGRSDHHQKTINKYGAKNILIGRLDCSSEEIAFDLEKGLIKCFRRMGVELVNKTDGGDGVSGLKHSDETKERIGDLFNDPDYRERHSNSVKDAHVREKERYCASAKESQNRPEVKTKHFAYQGSPEVVAAKSEWGKKAWSDPEKKKDWRAKIDAALGSDETKARMSKSQKGRKWVTDGVTNRKVMPDEANQLVASGWRWGYVK